MKKQDSLFDTRVTVLDAVKIAVLLVTGFSTYNIADLITPAGNLSWVREFGLVAIVEGAFLGFEYATHTAKNIKQQDYGTLGSVLALAVIAMFAGVSGLIEVGGQTLLTQSAGDFMGMSWMVRDVVMVFTLTVVVAWLSGLLFIYRLYSLADPDKAAELRRNQTYGELQTASNNAFEQAMRKAQPTVSVQRALATILEDLSGELPPAAMDNLLREVEDTLRQSVYGVGAAQGVGAAFSDAPASQPAPKRGLVGRLIDRLRGGNAEPQGVGAHVAPAARDGSPLPYLPVGDGLLDPAVDLLYERAAGFKDGMEFSKVFDNAPATRPTPPRPAPVAASRPAGSSVAIGATLRPQIGDGFADVVRRNERGQIIERLPYAPVPHEHVGNLQKRVDALGDGWAVRVIHPDERRPDIETVRVPEFLDRLEGIKAKPQEAENQPYPFSLPKEQPNDTEPYYIQAVKKDGHGVIPGYVECRRSDDGTADYLKAILGDEWEVRLFDRSQLDYNHIRHSADYVLDAMNHPDAAKQRGDAQEPEKEPVPVSVSMPPFLPNSSNGNGHKPVAGD